MTTPDDHGDLFVDYHVIAAFSRRPDLVVEGHRDGSWLVDRNCATCRVTVQLPHPRHREFDAFRVTVEQLGCFAGWAPRNTYLTITPRAGTWHVVERWTRPDAPLTLPGTRRPCPATR